MNDRLSKIFEVIPDAKIFADIGCDHGYIAESMIKAFKCEKVYIADISPKSLKKAEKLLDAYIKEGKAKSFVSNGFAEVPPCDVALVAGMGGEIIVDIMKNASRLPDKLVLQPMRNCDKVRKTAISLGYKIDLDYVFRSGKKFYTLILLEKGKDVLTELELKYGRTNITDKGEDFRKMILEEIAKKKSYLDRDNISPVAKEKIYEEIKELEGVL